MPACLAHKEQSQRSIAAGSVGTCCVGCTLLHCHIIFLAQWRFVQDDGVARGDRMVFKPVAWAGAEEACVGNHNGRIGHACHQDWRKGPVIGREQPANLTANGAMLRLDHRYLRGDPRQKRLVLLGQFLRVLLGGTRAYLATARYF